MRAGRTCAIGACFVLFLAAVSAAEEPPKPSSSATNPPRATLPGVPNPHAFTHPSAASGPNPHAVGFPSVQAPRSPTSFHETPPPEDALIEDASPVGTLVIETLNGEEQPVAGVNVELEATFESVAEGKHENRTKGISDAEGRFTLGGLKADLRSSYVISAHFQGAHYRTKPFRLPEKSGLRARVHVYPAVTNIEDAFIGVRNIVYVELRESSFHFEVLYRIFNMSRVAWVPSNVSIALPERAEGFTPSNEPTQLRVDEAGKRAFLEGTYPPGQTDVGVRFQIPSRNEERKFFVLGTLPHVADMRVITQKTKTLTMSVPGFDHTGSDTGPNGAEVLFARKVLGEKDRELGAVTIELGGLPVTGPERWYAVALAVALAAAGFAGIRRQVASAAAQRSLSAEERTMAEEAKAVLLGELRLLEKAKADELIGPRTYEATRKDLLDALARLALILDAPAESPSSELPTPERTPG